MSRDLPRLMALRPKPTLAVGKRRKSSRVKPRSLRLKTRDPNLRCISALTTRTGKERQVSLNRLNLPLPKTTFLWRMFLYRSRPGKKGKRLRAILLLPLRKAKARMSLVNAKLNLVLSKRKCFSKYLN